MLAIEVMTGCRALDLRAPLAPARATGAVRDLVRTRVVGPGPDRFVSPDIEAVTDLVASGAVARVAVSHAAAADAAPGRTSVTPTATVSI
ncbi:histidine ammonia-lyase [Microbacterium proteolyticum]|nr:histidine ammonia-lyase [Microbacterium proteolyticum]